MSFTQFKNLFANICIFMLSVILLIRNYSLVALITVLICTVAAVLVTILFNKNEKAGVLMQLDIYIVYISLVVIGVKFGNDFLFTADEIKLIVKSCISGDGSRIAAFITSLIILWLFTKACDKQKDAVKKSIGCFLGIWGFLVLLFFSLCGNFLLVIPTSILCVCGAMINMFRVELLGDEIIVKKNNNDGKNTTVKNKRTQRLTILSGVVIFLLEVFFGAFSKIQEISVTYYISGNILRWYNLLFIVLLSAAEIGYIFYSGKENRDIDSVFFCGLTGFALLVKSTTYYYFPLCWLSVFIFALIWTYHLWKFATRWKSATRYEGLSAVLKIDHYDIDQKWFCLFCGAVLALFNIGLYYGHIFEVMAVLIGAAVIRFVPSVFKGWKHDAVFWQMILAVITCVAYGIIIHNRMNSNIQIAVFAVFVLTSIVLWMLNYDNEVGSNKLSATKTAIAIIFAVVVLIPTIRYGTKIKIELSDDTQKVQSALTAQDDLIVHLEAKGKDNEITYAEYYWKTPFTFSDDADDENNTGTVNILQDVINYNNTKMAEISEDDYEITPIDGDSAIIPAREGQLTIKVVDKYGITTTKTCWFYLADDKNISAN